MGSHRLERVRELLKRQIGDILRREIPIDQAGLITVNHVTVSGDLQYATVYVSLIGDADQVKHAPSLLQSARKRLQGLVGRAVALKHTPQLRFIVDDSIAQGNRVLQILDELDQPPSPTSPST